LDRQWFAALPQSLRDQYASRPIERSALLEQWKAEERERKVGRAEALRDLEFGATGLPLGDLAYRAELQKWVRETLEPKLNERERRRLVDSLRRSWLNYVVNVAAMSATHTLKPPGPADAWRRLAERRPPRSE
jgi:hypothetical protein